MLVNSVRLVSDTRRWWVADLTSISEHGETFEAVLQVGDIDDPDVLQEIGEAYLAIQSSPQYSIVAEATRFDGRVGDIATVEGNEVRCVGVRRTLDPMETGDGRWRSVATFNTLRQEQAIRQQRELDRLLTASGNGSAQAATVKGSRTKVPKGKLAEIGRHSWTFNELWEIDEEPWQIWKVEDFCRLYAFRAMADWFTLLDGEVDEKVTDGPSSFTFSINGTEYDPAPWVVIDEEDYLGIVPLWGSAILNPGDEVRVWALQRGGHINGSLELLFTEPI